MRSPLSSEIGRWARSAGSASADSSTSRMPAALDHASDLIELYPDNGSLPIYVAPLQRLQLAWAQARLKPELEHGLFIGAAGFEDGLALSRAERRHHIVAGLCRLPNELG